MTRTKVKPITIPEILERWRKYYLATRPGTTVRHGTTGEFGTTIGPVKQPANWQVTVKLDNGGEEFDTNYSKLYPAWWPDQEWPWLRDSSESSKGAK